MGKEIPEYMSDEFDKQLPQEFSLSEIENFSRKYCEPTELIYKNDPELAKDPFKAIAAIDWHGPSLEKVSDPVDGLLVARAKLDVAEKELRLNVKQKEHFSGVKENIDGAIGFLDTLRSKAESKAVRAIASGATIIGMTLGAAGCGNALARPIEEPTSTPPIVEMSPTPFEPSTPINPTLTVSPKPTEIQSITEGAPYPKNADNLARSPSVSGSEARKKIIDYGAENDLKALEDWYKKEGVLKAGSSNFLVPVVYEENGNFYWNAMVKSGSGDFIKFTITEGPEANELVRAMGMVNYLDTEPSFETSNLSDPPGLAGLNQQIIWDKSGWSVVGAFQGDDLIAWFNADAPNGGEWVKIQELVPTPTQEIVEISFDTSKSETISAVDGNSYQGYLIEDEYGPRLVDETNSIILVKENDSWRPAESADFSKEYPAVNWETKIGKADGFEIPITLGLAANVREGVGFNFSEIHMTQLGADDLASAFLYYSFTRYKNIMGHPDISYEEYVSLLKKGSGNIEILDSVTRKPVLVDPRNGFSLVITGDNKLKMPVVYNNDGYYYSSDDQGKLLASINGAYNYNFYLNNRNYSNSVNTSFVYGSAKSVLKSLGEIPDKCMVNNYSVESKCGQVWNLNDPSAAITQFSDDVKDFRSGASTDPLFILD